MARHMDQLKDLIEAEEAPLDPNAVFGSVAAEADTASAGISYAKLSHTRLKFNNSSLWEQLGF